METIETMGAPLVINDEFLSKENRVYSLTGVSLKRPKIVGTNPTLYEYQIAIDQNRTLRVHTTVCDLVRNKSVWEAVFMPHVLLKTDHLGPVAILLHEEKHSAVVMTTENSWQMHLVSV